MPASGNDGIGVKIVTLMTGDERDRPQTNDADSITSNLDKVSLVPSTDAASSLSSARSTTPKGSLTLFDKGGNPRALVNAEEITAFRTALASTMLFKKRHNVHDVVVFGAGKQAYWHIRLALLLRGPEIHHLNIISRDFERAHQLLQNLYKPHEEPKQFDRDVTQIPVYLRSTDTTDDLARPKIQIVTPGHGEYERLLKSTIRSSSVIFFTTPSTTPLFPASYLTNPEGRKKGRYLAAIGSYKPHMVEIHPDIIKQNVAPDHGHRHFHKHATQGGAIIVDSVDACIREAGEIVQAGLTANEVVEIGELVMLKRDAERRRADCAARRLSNEDQGLDEGGVELGECESNKKKNRKGWGSGNKDKKSEGEKDGQHHVDKGLLEWLQKGNVIYKSVGLGLMDVVVGSDLVRMADERRIGTRIDNF